MSEAKATAFVVELKAKAMPSRTHLISITSLSICRFCRLYLSPALFLSASLCRKRFNIKAKPANGKTKVSERKEGRANRNEIPPSEV